jgi:mannose-1-phosphate guanylyltransferase
VIAGEDRPKQFCRLYGGSTLLGHTRSRLAQVISPEHTLYTVVKDHEKFYTDELSDVPPSRVVVQPFNKGTTAAVLYSLFRIASLANDPIVGFFPTDHHYAKELDFVASVRSALLIARTRPRNIVLLGASADRAEVEYGWIEPGKSLECPITNALLRVNRFWEKPSARIAQALLERGCLWNTFVMIGRASTFLEILKATVPQIVRAFGGDSGPEPNWARGDIAYAALSPGDFSQQVLSLSTEHLAVLRLNDVGWSDLGTPERVRLAMLRSGRNSRWLESIQHENTDNVA